MQKIGLLLYLLLAAGMAACWLFGYPGLTSWLCVFLVLLVAGWIKWGKSI